MRTVYSCCATIGARATGHDAIGRREVARRLASIMGAPYGGESERRGSAGSRPYWVPDDALSCARARRLGIASTDDLFGGVVPAPFVATKAISHRLVDDDAPAPEGWSAGFGEAVEPVVLPGRTAFDLRSAARAARTLLADGPVRVKACSGIGGSGQTVASTPAEVDAALASIGPDEIESQGVVIERNLADATTWSIGQVVACGIALSYCGVQHEVRNRKGRDVYGGSTIDCVRGDFTVLLARTDPPVAAEAVAAALRYDEAATRLFPGFFASRRNYDVIAGRDAASRQHVGVLEQSWRVGGASAAELLALEAFVADPALERVRASTVETYDRHATVPGGAFVYFRGDGSDGAPLAKYATLEADVHA